MTVPWQVTGVRQNPYAEAHWIQVEEDKAADERGFFLHPEEYGQPQEKGIEYAHRPPQQQESEVIPHRNGEAPSQQSEVAQAQK